jgi:anti-sigma-K factor RskA
MSDRHDHIDDAVAKMGRARDEQLLSLSQSPAAQALFADVVTSDELQRASDAPLRSPSLHAGRPRRRARFALAAAAAAVVAVAVGFTFAVAVHHAPPAPAPVAFRNSGSYIVATVMNPNAAEQELQAAFAAHNLNIHLKLAPVSPEMVGSVVYMGTLAGPSEIGALSNSGSAAQGGPQPIGLLIPVGFKAHADIVLGRAAKPGEIYRSPGGALDGMRLLEATGV